MIGLTASRALALTLFSILILVSVSCREHEAATDDSRVVAAPADVQQDKDEYQNQPAADEQEPAAEAGTLAQRIADFKSGREQPADVKQTMAEETDKLRAQGISASAVKAGEQAPDFSLSSAAGEEYRLSDMLSQGPVVLIFFRGSW